MAWDFETDPEFQEKLDWRETFVREQVEPLDYADVAVGKRTRNPLGTFRGASDKGRSVHDSSLSGLSPDSRAE